jgi:DNA-binding winged helix-turn-helix (wHTH) protein
MKAIWPDSFVEEGNLSQNVFLLRKALGESPSEHRYIVTIPGRGYRFAAEVQDVNVAGGWLRRLALRLARRLKRSRSPASAKGRRAAPDC